MNFELHLGDCLDPVTGLGSLADQSVDHVICDPPYSKHTHEAQRRGGGDYTDARASFRRNRSLGFAHLSAEVRAGAAVQFARIASRWVLVFTDHDGGQGWADDLKAAGLEVVRFGIWRKTGATPQFTGDRPAQGHEVIVIAHQPGRKRWNGGGRHGVWECPIVLDRGHNGARNHTTEKPLRLMEMLVADFTDPGDLILDPFAGSGSTGVAALGLGRRFCGWEMSPVHHATALRRLSETREQLSLLAKLPKRKQMGMGL